MIAYGYTRVSTKGQEDGESLDLQESVIRAWCDSNGHLLKSIHTETASGVLVQQKELERCLNLVRLAGGILVVSSIDRLTRSLSDTVWIQDKIADSHASICSVKDCIDTTSAAGKMMFRMLAVLAEFERDQIKERTSAALQHKRGKGERVGNLPYGFQVSPDGVHMEENPEEQEQIALMKKLRSEGYSLRHINATLIEQGYRTRSGSGSLRLNTISEIVRSVPKGSRKIAV